MAVLWGQETEPAFHSGFRDFAGERHAHDLHSVSRTEFSSVISRDWWNILDRLAVGRSAALRAAFLASRNATSLQAELLAAGAIEPTGFASAVAAEFGLRFVARVDPDRLLMRENHRLAALKRPRGRLIARIEERGETALLVVPDGDDLDWLRRLAANPETAARIRIVPHDVLRRAIAERSRENLRRDAVHGLFTRDPRLSARIVGNAWQGLVVGALLVAVPLGLLLDTNKTLVTLHLAATLFFACCVVLRVLALTVAAPLRLPALAEDDPADMPRYSVLVALRREAEMVPQLLVALGRLSWPRSKLEIKLVCEADDAETLEALRAHGLHPSIEIIEVPPCEPRTKPKALAYALPFCSGEIVALFDAEDRPHPLQLREAWQSFRSGGDDLACVQAPLVVANFQDGLTPRLFAFEYAGLFRGLLPWLAGQGLMLPLGGTSNHFRRAALDDIGGWDPYNVTEDADLGLRLARFGYRTKTIAHPTLEDGPRDFATWLPQRTRWFKGWLQTWLVHMRSPVVLARQVGTGTFIVSQILFLGLLISALVHPFFVVTILWTIGKLAVTGTVSLSNSIIFFVDLANIAFGYGAFLALGAQTLASGERSGLRRAVVFTPVYWLMLSVAAWRSLWEIWRRPHHWNKTPHVSRRRP